MAHVFISHASRDVDRARELSKDLQKLGHETFLAEEKLKVGEKLPLNRKVREFVKKG